MSATTRLYWVTEDAPADEVRYRAPCPHGRLAWWSSQLAWATSTESWAATAEPECRHPGCPFEVTS